MSESIPMLVMQAIGILSTPITFYLGFKYAKRNMKTELEQWLNSETGQKALYSVGVLIGAGAKGAITGSGKGSKPNWKDLLIQIGLGWAQQKGIIPGLSGPPQQPLNSELPP